MSETKERNYNIDSQKSVLAYLVEKHSHDIAKFEALYNMSSEEDKKARSNVSTILLSNVWSTEEKMKLFQLYEYIERAGKPIDLVEQCVKASSFYRI